MNAAIEPRLAFWCAYHEALVTPEHFFRCEILRPPPPAIHYHPARRECVKAAWATEAIDLTVRADA